MSRPVLSALVLGGYGNFGRLIARSLAASADLEVVVAGRDGAKASALAASLGCRFAELDAQDPGLGDRIAAIAAGAHYVDIADAREFVCGIGELDADARAHDVLVVSGASSVPALSSAVVDRYSREFTRLDEIDIGICTAARIPGEATVRAALGYCGRPIPQWSGGRWREAWGWQGLRRHRFRHIAETRWLCDADVPDMTLLPLRFPTVRAVRFGAGLQPGFAHLALWALAGCRRAGLVGAPVRASGALARVARRFEAWGSDRSAMFVRLAGTGRDGSRRALTWELAAERFEGMSIPCAAAIVLARKLATGKLRLRGAMPCVGFLELAEYLDELRALPVSWGVAT